MDGRVEIELVKLDFPATVVPPGVEGSVRLAGEPVGRNMGFMRLGRGHQALLPPRAAYRFRATDGVGVILLQTILGPHSVQKWSDDMSHVNRARGASVGAERSRLSQLHAWARSRSRATSTSRTSSGWRKARSSRTRCRPTCSCAR